MRVEGRYFSISPIAVVILSIAFAAVPRGGLASPNLGKLDCVGIITQLNEGAKSFEITQEEVRATLLRALRAKMPKLAVDDGCLLRNNLYFSAILHTFETEIDAVPGYVATIALEVRRRVRIVDLDIESVEAVWRQGELLEGPNRQAKDDVLTSLDRLVSEFATAYRLGDIP